MSAPTDGAAVSGAELRRELGLLDAVGIGFGAIVGAGTFVVSGVAAGVADPAILMGLLIAAAAEIPAPLRIAALALPTRWIATVVSIGGVTAMLGVILSQLLGLSRMVFATARRCDLPRVLAHVHPRHGVPGRAVLLMRLALRAARIARHPGSGTG